MKIANEEEKKKTRAKQNKKHIAQPKHTSLSRIVLVAVGTCVWGGMAHIHINNLVVKWTTTDMRRWHILFSLCMRIVMGTSSSSRTFIRRTMQDPAIMHSNLKLIVSLHPLHQIIKIYLKRDNVSIIFSSYIRIIIYIWRKGALAVSTPRRAMPATNCIAPMATSIFFVNQGFGDVAVRWLSLASAFIFRILKSQWYAKSEVESNGIWSLYNIISERSFHISL